MKTRDPSHSTNPRGLGRVSDLSREMGYSISWACGGPNPSAELFDPDPPSPDEVEEAYRFKYVA